MASQQRTIVARRAQAAASRGGINGIEEDSRQDNEDTMVRDGYNRLNITALDGGEGVLVPSYLPPLASIRVHSRS